MGSEEAPWGVAGIRGQGPATTLLERFEAEARSRGCTLAVTTSFTFQGPAFYERRGYVEIFRWQDVPVAGVADVHFRKAL